MPKPPNKITTDRLRENLHYDPSTGVFTWRGGRGGITAGKVAGSACKFGYWEVYIDRKKHKAHRLAHQYMTGEPAPAEIDHINRDRSDNRWANLRTATRSENMRNQSMSSRNSSGIMGVYWNDDRKRWVPHLYHEGKAIYLGRYKDREEAIRVRKDAEEKYFGEYAATDLDSTED